MSLPMDFSTALWWKSVPVWEWEPLPAPASENAEPAPAGPAPAPPACPDSGEREGYCLVFKGYEITASLHWFPADSPLSRPWLRHEAPAGDRPARDAGDEAAARAARLARAAEADGTPT